MVDLYKIFFPPITPSLICWEMFVLKFQSKFRICEIQCNSVWVCQLQLLCHAFIALHTHCPHWYMRWGRPDSQAQNAVLSLLCIVQSYRNDNQKNNNKTHVISNPLFKSSLKWVSWIIVVARRLEFLTKSIQITDGRFNELSIFLHDCQKEPLYV